MSGPHKTPYHKIIVGDYSFEFFFKVVKTIVTNYNFKSLYYFGFISYRLGSLGFLGFLSWSVYFLQFVLIHSTLDSVCP